MMSVKRTHRVWCILLAVCLLYGGVCVNASAQGYSWYCVHAKEHKQPCADSQLLFVEDCGGYYIDHRHASDQAKDKVVYLTFDVGYENGNVARILDAMKEENVTGAFFILGNVAVKNPALVKRMADEGHLVCNHTYSHRDMTGQSREAVVAELERMEQACLEKTGVTMSKYFRPPEGKFDKELLRSAESLGYKTIFWSFAYADWDNGRQMHGDKAFNKIMENLHNGAVILLHPTSATNADVMGRVIREIKAQGYRFGTLDELTGA